MQHMEKRRGYKSHRNVVALPVQAQLQEPVLGWGCARPAAWASPREQQEGRRVGGGGKAQLGLCRGEADSGAW